MAKKMLHLINGDEFIPALRKIDPDGDVIVWREMLCEGPTLEDVGSEDFIAIRKEFFLQDYGISGEEYEKNFVSEFNKLSALDTYEEVVLWGEYDLFYHVNMLAALNYLVRHKKSKPVYLVCSGRIEGEKELRSLSELKDRQIKKLFAEKTLLSQDDLDMAVFVWQIYCGSNPNLLKAEILKSSGFRYLSSCIRAHLERFPSAVSGLNSLETNILKLIKTYNIKSEHHLLGYILSYQGYYGLTVNQLRLAIAKLKVFFEQKEDFLELNSKGEEALEGSYNFYRDLRTDDIFGGARKYDFLYNPETAQLLKL